MRKYKRAIYRLYAERKGIKASEFVHNSWEHYQIRKYGYGVRARNILRGTKPRKKWRAA